MHNTDLRTLVTHNFQVHATATLETTNDQQQEYGVENILYMLNSMNHPPADIVLERIIRQARCHSNHHEFDDDICAVAVQFQSQTIQRHVIDRFPVSTAINSRTSCH